VREASARPPAAGGMVQLDTKLNHIIKIASRCNLNCSYCYVYNQADATWRERPATMSRETFAAAVERIRRHCVLSGQDDVMIAFHGGEPTLVGSQRFGWMCAHAREQLGDLAEVAVSVQTNGTRLDPAWLAVLREHDVQIGISLDGPRDINDANRVDRRGRGSHDAVVNGIAMLNEAELPFHILSVVALGADPLDVHHHFLELGCSAVCYLLPSDTHETVAPLRDRYGPTPVADFLIPIFDDWWFNSSIDVSIREFWNLGRVVMGGPSQVEMIGNPPLRFVCVETDGSIQGLDKLRSCEHGMATMPLNVHDADFREIAQASPFHAEVMRGLPLPAGCHGCPEQDTCAGGHLPNRYSRARGFDNPSVWCADLLALFAHVRLRMGVSHQDTRRRRAALERLRTPEPAAAQLL
jgi:uncharacterized protein